MYTGTLQKDLLHLVEKAEIKSKHRYAFVDECGTSLRVTAYMDDEQMQSHNQVLRSIGSDRKWTRIEAK